MPTTIQAPDIERAAVTILHQMFDRIHEPVAREYITHITSDPDFQEPLVVHDVHTLPALKGYGYQPSPEAVERAAEYAASLADDPKWLRVWRKRDTELALNLAGAIISFRRHGRPSGDQVSAIGDIAYLQTSLAAAVAEFAIQYANAAFDAGVGSEMEQS